MSEFNHNSLSKREYLSQTDTAPLQKKEAPAPISKLSQLQMQQMLNQKNEHTNSVQMMESSREQIQMQKLQLSASLSGLQPYNGQLQKAEAPGGMKPDDNVTNMEVSGLLPEAEQMRISPEAEYVRQSDMAINLMNSPAVAILRESPEAKELMKTPEAEAVRNAPEGITPFAEFEALRKTPQALALRLSPAAMILKQSPEALALMQAPEVGDAQDSPTNRALEEKSKGTIPVPLLDEPSLLVVRGPMGEEKDAESETKKSEQLSEEDKIQQAAQEGQKGSSQTLPFADIIQKLFGRHDISDIKAFIGEEAAKANEAMGSEAYATGTSVVFREAPDLHTAAHEAAHIVQQRAGISLQGGVGKKGDKYEQNADAVADLVVKGKSAEAALDEIIGESQPDQNSPEATQE